jgi:hypothetical protein
MARGFSERRAAIAELGAFSETGTCTKKKGATGITTVAPLVAGQWGRGDNRLPE